MVLRTTTQKGIPFAMRVDASMREGSPPSWSNRKLTTLELAAGTASEIGSIYPTLDTSGIISISTSATSVSEGLKIVSETRASDSMPPGKAQRSLKLGDPTSASKPFGAISSPNMTRRSATIRPVRAVICVLIVSAKVTTDVTSIGNND